MQHFHSQLWFLLQFFSVRAVNFVNFLFLLQLHNWPYNYYLGFLFTSQNHQNKQNKMLIKKEKITLVNSTKVMLSKLKHTQHTLSRSLPLDMWVTGMKFIILQLSVDDLFPVICKRLILRIAHSETRKSATTKV